MAALLCWIRAALFLHLLSEALSGSSVVVLGTYLPSAAALPDLYEASLSDLQAGLTAGRFSSVELVKAYFARIEEVNFNGPELRAIIETNPSALAQAAALDRERKITRTRGPLHGIPVLVKDNVATMADEGMNTTAGSWALYGSVVPDDAGVVKRLRKAGAIILGKANLSEWSHARGDLASGWSGRGGQSSSAYYPGGDPCGSSGGSAISTSIGLAAVALGTETDGSITCPASYNNLVGIKPTVGLTSRAGVIPITTNQDTVGPLARTVTDAAIVLNAIAGPDPNDNFTLAQPYPLPDYTTALSRDALAGKRIGVPRTVFLDSSMEQDDTYIEVVLEQALDTLRELGATIVDPADIPSARQMIEAETETLVAMTDFKVQINEWFDSLLSNPSGVSSLEDLISFNNENPSLEAPEGYVDQSSLIDSQATEGFTSAYFEALALNHEMGRERGIDAALKDNALDALVLPAKGFDYITKPSAIAGYPIVTVPLGFYPDDTTIVSAGPVTFYPAPGIPIGLSFLGTAWSEYDLIGYAYAYEQKTQTRLQRMAYDAAIPHIQIADVLGQADGIFGVGL